MCEQLLCARWSKVFHLIDRCIVIIYVSVVSVSIPFYQSLFWLDISGNLHICGWTSLLLTKACVMEHLNTNNFYFSFLLFFWFYINFLFLFLFTFLLDDKEVCDTAVTWQVTWCDVIGLEYGGKIWKMTSGHMYTTWWPWVGNEANMRL